MILFQLFVALLTVYSTSAEDSATCGSLPANFNILLDTAAGLMDAFTLLAFQYSSANPILANGFVKSLECKAEQVQVFAAMGTSRMTGIDSSLISSILYGQIEPPFTKPLDCIEDSLVLLREKRKNVSSVELVSIAALFLATNVGPDSDCSTYEDFAGSYLKNVYSINEPIINAYEKYFPGISSINMMDLYVSILEPMNICGAQGIGIAAADLVNASQIEGLDFAEGAITELSHPLSCIETVFRETLDFEKELHDYLASIARKYSETAVSSSSSGSVSQSSSSSSVCGKIGSISKLTEAALEGIEGMKSYTMENAQISPELVPALISDLLCRNNGFLVLISQGIEKITGIKMSESLGVFLNMTNPPFSEPLSCIESELSAVRDANLILKNDFILSLKDMAVNPEGIIDSSCSAVENFLVGYNETISSILSTGFNHNIEEVKLFTQLEMTELLPTIVQSYQSCKIDSLVDTFSTLLNASLDDAKNFIKSSQEPVPPYSCIQDIIRFFIDGINDSFASLTASITEIIP